MPSSAVHSSQSTNEDEGKQQSAAGIHHASPLSHLQKHSKIYQQGRVQVYNSPKNEHPQRFRPALPDHPILSEFQGRSALRSRSRALATCEPEEAEAASEGCSE